MSYLILSKEEQHKLQILAIDLKGIPYKYGAEVVDLSVKPDFIKAIDCSELVEYMYYQLHYRAPDGAANQYEASGETLQPEIGDLVHKKDKAGKVIHVGMVIETEGTVMILEASGSQGCVVIRSLEEFKTSPKGPVYAGIRRFKAERLKRIAA